MCGARGNVEQQSTIGFNIDLTVRELLTSSPTCVQFIVNKIVSKIYETMKPNESKL